MNEKLITDSWNFNSNTIFLGGSKLLFNLLICNQNTTAFGENFQTNLNELRNADAFPSLSIWTSFGKSRKGNKALKSKSNLFPNKIYQQEVEELRHFISMPDVF